MGKTELVDKILSDARARAAELDAERTKSVAAVKGKLAVEVSGLESSGRERTRRDAEVVLERGRSSARMESRNAVMAARWQVVDRVIAAAAERVRGAEDYAELIAGIVGRYAQAEDEVLMATGDAARFGKRLAVKTVSTADITGGVVIRSGRRDVSFSLGQSLAEVRGQLAGELSQLLFGR